jgi:hypothetical protein
VSKVVVVETRRQHAGVGVIQSFNGVIRTIGVEMVIMPCIDAFKRGVLIGFAAKLGSGSSGVSVRRNMNQNSALLATTTGVVGIPQMVFTNPIIGIHGNRTID